MRTQRREHSSGRTRGVGDGLQVRDDEFGFLGLEDAHEDVSLSADVGKPGGHRIIIPGTDNAVSALRHAVRNTITSEVLWR